MKIKKITSRWFVNFFIILTILVFFNIISIVTLRQHYLNYASQNLDLSAATNEFKIESIEDNALNGLNNEIKKIIENFKHPDNILAIGFNLNGRAIVASNKNLNSIYSKILNSMQPNKFNIKETTCRCYLPNGEHIMVKIKPISSVNSEFSKIMYIISLRKFDNIVLRSAILYLSISLLFLITILILQLLFLKSVIKPLRTIIKATKKVAIGQNGLNIKQNFNFELKELYDSINLITKKLNLLEYTQNEFISSISHELRTPLTAIKGWSETILTSNSDKQILRKGMNIISKEVSRLSKMVEELLDFSKIKNGHLKLFKEKMDPFAELQEAILIYSDIAAKEEKKLIYEEQANIPTIFGDKNRIKQVFINIIDNALKYSAKGSVVKITAIVGEKAATVIVKDNGTGIAKRHLSQITKKFYQTSSLNKGSGIGLAFVKEIVQKHNGTLQFESKQNKGTTVKISFPLLTQPNLNNSS